MDGTASRCQNGDISCSLKCWCLGDHSGIFSVLNISERLHSLWMSSCKQNKLTSSLVIHQIGKCGSQPERGLTPPGEAAATANTFQLTQHKSDRSIQSINTISKKKTTEKNRNGRKCYQSWEWELCGWKWSIESREMEAKMEGIGHLQNLRDIIWTHI